MMCAVFTADISDELVSSSCRPLCNAHNHIWANSLGRACDVVISAIYITQSHS